MRRRQPWLTGLAVLLALGGTALWAAEADTSVTSVCKTKTGKIDDECRTKIAVLVGDPTICAQLKSASERNYCVILVAHESGQYALCEKLPATPAFPERARDTWRDLCVGRVENAGAEPALCRYHSSADARCECVIKAARLTGPSACQELPPDERACCLEALLDDVPDLAQACKGSEACLLTMARHDVSLCASIPGVGADRRIECVRSALADRGDWIRESSCENLKGDDLRDACFAGVAASPGHGSACTKVVDLERRDSCWADAAKKDASLCKQLGSAAALASCLEQADYATTDVQLCESLADADRTRCAQVSESLLAQQLERLR